MRLFWKCSLLVPGVLAISAASWILSSRAVGLSAQAQTVSNHDATRVDFEQLMKQLSN